MRLPCSLNMLGVKLLLMISVPKIIARPTVRPADSPIGWRPNWWWDSLEIPPRWVWPIRKIPFCYLLYMQNCAARIFFYEHFLYGSRTRVSNTYQVAKVGSRSVITRNIYRKQVSNLKNRLTIRMRRPVIF